MRELRVPDAVLNHDGAREVLRVWLGPDGQGLALRPDTWSDPAAWGLLLVDLARHVAHGFSQMKGGDPEEILARIKAGFDAEWASATDPARARREPS